MMKFSEDSVIELDLNIIMGAIRAVEKTVTEDIPHERDDRRLETDNYLAFIRGDYINQNLRRMCTIEDGELLRLNAMGGRVVCWLTGSTS